MGGGGLANFNDIHVPFDHAYCCSKVDSQKKEVSQSIEQSFDMLKALLDQRKAELVKKASSLVEEKKDALTAQKKGFQVAQTEIQSLVEFVGRNIEITSDHDLMCICTQLQTKMEEEKKRHRQLSLEPSATADIFCNPPSPEDIPKLLGTVSTQPKPVLQGTTNTCELGTQMQMCLVAPTAMLADISARVRCVSNPSILSSLYTGQCCSKKCRNVQCHLHPSSQGPT